METQVAYTTPTKHNVSHTRKELRKAKPIPEGYMSLDESEAFSTANWMRLMQSYTFNPYKHQR